MKNIKRSQIFLFFASLISIATFLMLIFGLYKHRHLADLDAILWVAGFFIAVIILIVGIILIYSLCNCGKKKKDVRYG